MSELQREMRNETGERVQLERRPIVLVYRANLLALSEPFIKEQVLALRRWRGILVGLRPMHELPLDGMAIRILWGDHCRFCERVRWKLSTWLERAPRRAIKRLEREGASLLHAHFGFDAVEAWPIAKALDLPMLVTLHGVDINIHRDWWKKGHGGRSMTGYPDRLLKLAQQPQVRFIAVSEAIRRRAVSYGIPEEKIFVRYMGLDLTKFSSTGRPIIERERRVLFVGRLVEKKGCEFLIRAFAKVQREVPDAVLIIIGDGIDRPKLEDLVNKLNVRVQFYGARETAEVVRELQMAKCLCLPSVHAANGDAEGFGMVLLEAQASGVPVVTSAMGGASEGIDEGVTGFSFPERDVDALSARLNHLLTNDDVATSMSIAGPRFVAKHFDIRQCTERLESLYDLATSNF